MKACSGDDLVCHWIGDIAPRNLQDKDRMSICYFYVAHFHWIAGPADGKTVVCDTLQHLNFVATVSIEKLTPIIGEDFPQSHSFQQVNRRTIERSETMDLVANTAIKELIMDHGWDGPGGCFYLSLGGEEAHDKQPATSKTEKQIRSCAVFVLASSLHPMQLHPFKTQGLCQ